MEDLFGMLIGAFLAGCIGIFTVYFTKFLEEKRTKKHTSKALLLEVQANQNRLQPLSDSLAKVSDSDIEVSEEDTLPNELSFDRTIYSTLSDKIGLLDNKGEKRVVPYYVEIKDIEEQYKKLELIQGLPLPNLLVIQLKDATGGYNNSPGWDEIEDFLRNAEKVYNLGKELTKSLNGEI